MNCNKGSCGDPVLKGLVTCNHRNQVRPTVGFDVDDVCLDLIGEWLRRYNLAWGDSLRPEDIKSWMISSHTKPECGLKILELLREPDLYDCVQPIAGALEMVEEVREFADIMFVTSCEDVTMESKYRNLKRNSFIRGMDEYAPIRKKHKVMVDVLVDDGMHNVDAFPGKSILVTRPHNQLYTPKTAVRADTFTEVVARLRALLGP